MKAKDTIAMVAVLVFGWSAVTGCAHVADNGSISSAMNKGTANVILDLYQGPLNHLSAVRSGSCPMHPSCSAYSRQAIEEHGFFTGWMMAMDRLMRCGRDETRLVPPVRVGNSWKYYDPLEANDFWWKSEHLTDLP